MSSEELTHLVTRAEALMQLERWQEASFMLGQALAIAPDEPAVLATLARVLHVLDEVQEAMRLAKQLVHVAPENTEGHAIIAELALQSGDLEQAQRSADAWLQLTPDSYAAQETACRITSRRGHRRQALRRADDIRRHFAHKADAHLLHAYMAQRMMRIRLLRESAERALELEPQNSEAILLTGRAWAYKTKTELKAVELLANGCALYPDNEEMREELDSAIKFYVGSATVLAFVALIFPPSLFYIIWDITLGRQLRIRKLTPGVKALVRKRMREKNALAFREMGIGFGLITLIVTGFQLHRGDYTFDTSSIVINSVALLGLCAGLWGYRLAHKRANF